MVCADRGGELLPDDASQVFGLYSAFIVDVALVEFLLVDCILVEIVCVGESIVVVSVPGIFEFSDIA